MLHATLHLPLLDGLSLVVLLSPFGHEPRRNRKLLLHDRQIQKWGQRAEREGYTIVPLALYFRDGWAKLKIGLAKGRQKHDKRQAIKEREMERRMKQRQSDYNF